MDGYEQPVRADQWFIFKMKGRCWRIRANCKFILRYFSNTDRASIRTVGNRRGTYVLTEEKFDYFTL